MAVELKTTSNSTSNRLTRQTEHIQAELIHLTYRQSHIGIFISVISSVALAYLLWDQVNHNNLIAWLSAILSVSIIRAGVVHLYHRHKVQSHMAKPWGRWNIIGLATTGLLWGATMVAIFPDNSLTHQLCIALLLCGIIATGISLYAAVPLAVLAFSLPIFLAWIIRFLTFNDTIHIVIAGLAILYLVIMVLTSYRIFETRRQLLITRFNLANRVSERSQKLKEANAYLKTEIRERKDIEERLRQERDRLEVITTTIGAGLAVISKKYKTLWTNQIFEEMFGKNTGLFCFENYYQRDNACKECGARMVFEQGYEKVVHERKKIDPNNETRWFQIITTPIRNAEGRIRAALELVLPITEHKNAETAKRRMSEKLEEARKTEAIANLAGGIAHQFNNALAVIAGNIELLEFDYKADPNINSFSNPILSATEKMTQLTGQLLAYAKGGKYKEHPNDLSYVVESTLSFIKHTIPNTITVHKELESNLPKVNIDTTQVQMVISSIIANAVEATDEKGEISVYCNYLTINNKNQSQYSDIPPGQYITFTISDNGSGMDEKTQKRIFEPFFTTKFEGRGLGMAAVYGIIKNHGGYIQVASKLNKGTDVYIYLPALTEEAVESHIEQKEQLFRGSGTILLVEDEIDIVEINKSWLERLGYNVIVATTAHDAIEMICHTKVLFDVVLLDMVLPDMNGAAIFPLIQKHRPNAKVIITSGYGQDESIQELLDAGADSFIQKPFTLSQISIKLNEVLVPSRVSFQIDDRSFL